MQSDKSTKDIRFVVTEPDSSSDRNLYQKLSQIAEKMPHSLVKLGLDSQNPQHREIFMTMYAINTGIDPHQLLVNSPYSSPEGSEENSTHTESIISQATAKIDEAVKRQFKTEVSTARNIDRGL